MRDSSILDQDHLTLFLCFLVLEHELLAHLDLSVHRLKEPERWRLAKLIVELSGAHDRTPFEDSLLQRLDYCWARLTQPTWFAQAWKAELSALPPLDDDRPAIPFWPHPADSPTNAGPVERWAARFEEPRLPAST